MLQSLQRLNEDVVANLTGIGEQGRSLAEDIDQVASGGAIREQTVEVFGRVLEQIRALDVCDAPQALSGQQVDASGLYCDLMGRYTMHSERQVHRAVTGADDRDAPSEKGSGEESELGENVELF